MNVKQQLKQKFKMGMRMRMREIKQIDERKLQKETTVPAVGVVVGIGSFYPDWNYNKVHMY